MCAPSSCCSKQRHTAQQHAIEARIYYPFHPRCGETVRICRKIECGETQMTVIPQPDGSVACIPSWMMQASAGRHALCAEPRFSLDVIRALRAELDAVLDILQPDSTGENARNDAQRAEPSTGSVRRRPAAGSTYESTKGSPGNAGPSSSDRDRRGAGRRGGRR